MILRGVQGRRDRACDQLLARRRQPSQKREEDPRPSCPATSAQSSGACNAKRDRAHPPFVRPPNNTLVSSAAASSFPSAFLHRTAPPPILPPPPPPPPPPFSSLLISSSFHLTTLYPLPTALDPTSPAIFTPRETISEDISAATHGTKDNRNPLTRRPILYSPRLRRAGSKL